jgi:hypothetical protein
MPIEESPLSLFLSRYISGRFSSFSMLFLCESCSHFLSLHNMRLAARFYLTVMREQPMHSRAPGESRGRNAYFCRMTIRKTRASLLSNDERANRSLPAARESSFAIMFLAMPLRRMCISRRMGNFAVLFFSSSHAYSPSRTLLATEIPSERLHMRVMRKYLVLYNLR